MLAQSAVRSTSSNHQTLAQTVADLRRTGLSYSRIGETMGFSKQRAFQLINKRPKASAKRTQAELGPKRMLTTREVAAMLGVHCNTVRRWAESGILRACRLGSRRDRRFYAESVEVLLKQEAKAG